MRGSTSVFSRGLMLVVIPIIFQLCFAVWLSVVLADAQRKLQEQWQSEELIRLACQLSRDSTDVLVYMQMPANIKSLVGDETMRVRINRPQEDYFRLQELAGKNPKHAIPLQHLKDVGLVMYQLQRKELENAERLKTTAHRKSPGRARWRAQRRARKRAELMREGKPIPPNLRESAPARGVVLGAPVVDDYKSTLKRAGPQFYESINEVVKSEEESMRDTNAFGAGAISKINFTLLLIALSSIGVTVFLGYLYSVSIRKPLQHLGENGKRLSRRETLLPAIAGKDEFSRLDQLLQVNSVEVEEALARERAVIENAADMICIVDEGGSFVSVNPFVEPMLGYLQEELLEAPVNSVVQAEQSLLADEYLRKAIADGESYFELRMKKRNGDCADTRWSCIWSPEEKKLFCVVQDVSEEKAIEQLKQDFADMISHDLRSPLMAMSNSLTLIEAGAKGEISQEAKVSVEASAKNVEKLIALVNDILDFQKLKAGKMQLKLERNSLQSIVKEAADLLIESAQHKSVELVLPEGELMVECDRNKILQTVVNLLSNAIKFSEAGSKVTVEISQSLDNVSLSVSDTGPGVPAEFRSKIFEPFEQAPSDRAREGTGLGLAICKLVADAHGGRIFVESNSHGANCDALEPGSGSVFVIELPVNAGRKVADA
jgi:PAS domain S-box-containing protein